MKIISFYNKKQWCILLALGSFTFSYAFQKSLQSPFFPKEAESKGSRSSEYGFVFGTFELISCLISPILGKHIDKLCPKKMLGAGIALGGVTSISFGFLDKVDAHTWFMVLAFSMRILEAVGSSAGLTACYCIAGAACPESVSASNALLKVFLNLGSVAGPTVGGYIFVLGGFMAPFLTIGTLMLLQALLVFIFFPNSKKENQNVNKNEIKVFGVLRLLPVAMDLLSTMVATIGLGFFAILEPHIRQFGLSPVVVGAILRINGIVNMVVSPLVGVLCDSGRVGAKQMIMAGSVVAAAGYTLIGPAPFLPLDTTLWLLCLGLALHGLGFAFIHVPSYSDAVTSALEAGLPADMALYGVVSGLLQAAFSIGDAIGPIVAGLLYDSVGYRMGTIFVMTCHGTLVATLTCYLIGRRCNNLSSYSPSSAATNNDVTRSRDDGKGSTMNPWKCMKKTLTSSEVVTDRTEKNVVLSMVISSQVD